MREAQEGSKSRLIQYERIEQLTQTEQVASSHFRDCAGDKASFESVDFSYCVFERCYFRKSAFKDCRFTGARFIDCNLREAQFAGCDLKYVTFRGSHVETRQMLANLPDWPNVRRDLMRALRVNAVSVGDVEAIKHFVREEIEAEREHLRQARLSKSGYYYDHYSGFRRQASVRWKSVVLWLDRWIWGHGEYPLRLLLSTAIYLTIATLVVAAFWTPREPGVFSSASNAVLSVFFGIKIDSSSLLPAGFSVVLAASRFVFLGLFVATLGKLISKR